MRWGGGTICSADMLRFCLALIGLFGVVGCGTRGVRFEGWSEPAIARAEDVQELESMPEEYRRLGEVSASCELTEGSPPPSGALLSDIDCSESRLMAALHERAAEVGGEMLVGGRCRSHEVGSNKLAVTCSAVVARPSDEARAETPLGGGKLIHDCSAPRASEAWNIHVHFARNESVSPRPPRNPESVREVPLPPVSHVRLGDLVTRCASGCSKVGVRLGLVAAAGRYGATDVVDVHCVAKHEGWMCSGAAMAYEVDPERNPSAR